MAVIRIGIVLIIACLGGLLGCAKAPKVEDPAQVVHRYFHAMEGRDCEGVTESLAAAPSRRLAEVGCDAAFEEFAEHELSLVAIEQVRRDGRDPQTMLVHSRVRMNGDEKVLILGVQLVSGQWKIVRM